ncbi:MAG: glycosyltransferase family 2 protein [Thermodesulfobacteriota bacterium]
MEPELTLFVACYNEEENIAATLDTVREALTLTGISAEVIVIDDASTDRSVELLEDWRGRHPGFPMKIVVNKRNQGLAFNYVEGAFLGAGRYYRLICGDNVEPVETLVQVFSHMGEADLILPYQPDFAGRSWSRQLISRTYTTLVNLISGHHVRYYNGLPLTLRYNVMRWHSNSHGFGFQADMVTRLLDRGFTYLEIPVKAVNRRAGRSKAFTLRNLASVMHSLLNIFLRRVAKSLYGYN